MTAKDPTELRRLYGRSKGRPLRAGQSDLIERLLPQLSVPEEGPIDSKRLFGDERPLHFEIGFGGGDAACESHGKRDSSPRLN